MAKNPAFLQQIDMRNMESVVGAAASSGVDKHKLATLVTIKRRSRRRVGRSCGCGVQGSQLSHGQCVQLLLGQGPGRASRRSPRKVERHARLCDAQSVSLGDHLASNKLLQKATTTKIKITTSLPSEKADLAKASKSLVIDFCV